MADFCVRKAFLLEIIVDVCLNNEFEGFVRSDMDSERVIEDRSVVEGGVADVSVT